MDEFLNEQAAAAAAVENNNNELVVDIDQHTEQHNDNLLLNDTNTGLYEQLLSLEHEDTSNDQTYDGLFDYDDDEEEDDYDDNLSLMQHASSSNNNNNDSSTSTIEHSLDSNISSSTTNPELLTTTVSDSRVSFLLVQYRLNVPLRKCEAARYLRVRV